jgi:hypothetical protein
MIFPVSFGLFVSVLASISKARRFSGLVNFTAGGTLMLIPDPENKEINLEQNGPA